MFFTGGSRRFRLSATRRASLALAEQEFIIFCACAIYAYLYAGSRAFVIRARNAQSMRSSDWRRTAGEEAPLYRPRAIIDSSSFNDVPRIRCSVGAWRKSDISLGRADALLQLYYSYRNRRPIMRDNSWSI